MNAMFVRGLKEDDGELKAVQKLLISKTAERDYSTHETCHLLLMLPCTWLHVTVMFRWVKTGRGTTARG